MFDFVREKKLVVQIILAAIIVPFAFWGVDSYQKAGDTGGVASVDGEKISQQEFEFAYRQQLNAMRERLGDKFDAAMFETPEAKRAILDTLVQQKILMNQAKKVGVTITDMQMAQVIQGIEAFQEKGKFDKKRFEETLASQNLNQLAFESKLREELMTQQVRSIYQQNGFSANDVIDHAIRTNERQWVVSVANISAQNFIASAKVDDAEIKKYYEQNQKEFQTPEQAKVEYVKFSRDALAAGIVVTDQEIEEYYKHEDHQAEFSTQEQRQASHILIMAAANAPQAEQDAAKKKAEDLLVQLKQSPAKFAELAKANSQDPISAANGGDLGMFARGMMEKSFEDAVYSLKLNEISSLTKTNYGYHIIQLTGIQAPKMMSLAEVRDSIADKLRQQRAADKFAEMAENFNNKVYTESNSLKPAADLVGAKVEQSDWLLKNGPDTELWGKKMKQAIFADESIKDKRNTSAIEIAPNTLLAARILEYKPAAARQLAEVENDIRTKLQLQQAVKMATEQGAKEMATLQKGGAAQVQWMTGQNISRAQRGALDQELMRKVFQVNRAKLPQYVGSETKGMGYTIVRIDEVKEADKADDTKRARYAQQIRQLTGEALLTAYMTTLKEKADVEIKMTDPAKTAN